MRFPGWLLFRLVLVAFELIADILAKQFAISGKLVFALCSMLGFIAANTAWIISLRTGAELSRGAVLFSVLSAIGARSDLDCLSTTKIPVAIRYSDWV